jgi:hypothetical protein
LISVFVPKAQADKEKPEALKAWFEEGNKEVLGKLEAWVNRISNGKPFIAGTDKVSDSSRVKVYEAVCLIIWWIDLLCGY